MDNAMTGAMIIMVPSMTNLTGSTPEKEVHSRRCQGLFSRLKKGALAPKFQDIGNRGV
jgi:hypothetical protein